MKAQVNLVESKGTYESKYGLMYKYEIHIGDHVGEYSCKKYATKEDEGFPFIIGSEVEYEFTDGQFPKIKLVSNWSGGGGGGYSGKKSNNSSFALSYAKDILVARKCSILINLSCICVFVGTGDELAVNPLTPKRLSTTPPPTPSSSMSMFE